MRVKINQDRLDGYARQDFQKALIESFDTPVSAQQILAYQLDKDINKIFSLVPGINMNMVWFEVIKEAERLYWSGNLLPVARKVSPENPMLLEFARRFRHGPEIAAQQAMEPLFV